MFIVLSDDIYFKIAIDFLTSKYKKNRFKVIIVDLRCLKKNSDFIPVLRENIGSRYLFATATQRTSNFRGLGPCISFSSSLKEWDDILSKMVFGTNPLDIRHIDLTPAQLKVLSLIISGFNVHSISNLMNISIKTVYGHCSALIKFFNLKSLTHLYYYFK